MPIYVTHDRLARCNGKIFFYDSVFQPVDVQQDIQYLSGQEFSLVRRVVFRLDLQGRKSVVVRVNPNCSIREVLQLLLVRFNLKLDNMVVHTVGIILYHNLKKNSHFL